MSDCFTSRLAPSPHNVEHISVYLKCGMCKKINGARRSVRQSIQSAETITHETEKKPSPQPWRILHLSCICSGEESKTSTLDLNMSPCKFSTHHKLIHVSEMHIHYIMYLFTVYTCQTKTCTNTSNRQMCLIKQRAFSYRFNDWTYPTIATLYQAVISSLL